VGGRPQLGAEGARLLLEDAVRAEVPILIHRSYKLSGRPGSSGSPCRCWPSKPIRDSTQSPNCGANLEPV
jgi:hypothetical protein